MGVEVAQTPSTLIWATVVILTVFVLRARILKMLKLMFKGLIQRGFAAYLYYFMPYYNIKLHSEKKELFSSMKEHLSRVDGDILEVGAGTGANFAFYPSGCSVVAVDPNAQMNYYWDCNKTAHPNINVKDYILGMAEDMSKIKDQSVSIVVTTLVLCTVGSVEEALKEIIRVLKPGGRLYFFEHVKGKGWLLQLQQICDPWWYYCMDGCILTRDTESYIRKAGFKNIECQRFDANIFLSVIKPHIMGFAEI